MAIFPRKASLSVLLPQKGEIKMCVGKIKLSEKEREKKTPTLNPQQPPWKEVI